MKEKVKYIDETEVEINIHKLGFRKAMQIAKTHLPINDLTFGKDDTMNIKGNIDLFGMSVACLETVKELDLDRLDSQEAIRIYKKYFEKDIMMSLGQGGNPN